MGEEADYIIDRMIGDWDNYSFREPRRGRGFQRGSGDFMWRTADGEVINMYDMSPAHRANAINICKQRGNTGKLKQLEQVQREMEKIKRPARPVQVRPARPDRSDIPF